jgi:hypothetical protein
MTRSHLVVVARDLTSEKLGILRGRNPMDGACKSTTKEESEYKDRELHG